MLVCFGDAALAFVAIPLVRVVVLDGLSFR